MPQRRRIGSTKATKKRVRKSGKSNSGQLERIEKLLGEDFESLSEAKKALASQSGPVRNKKSYTVRELSSKSHRTIKTFVPDLEEHKQELDTLKHEGDFWAAKIYGHGTYQLYPSIGGLADQLGRYRGLQEEHPLKALKNIEVIRVKGIEAQKYLANKKAEVKERWQKRQAQHKEDQKRKRKQDKKLKSLQKELAALKRKLRKRG